MSTLEGPRAAEKLVAITIPNVPQDLWRDFQDQARFLNKSVGALMVSLMAGALARGRPSEEGSGR